MKSKAAKVISIFSCKGGVGKTTTILNLAGIYNNIGKKVLIIDLDLLSGGIAISLNINVNKTIYNVYEDLKNNRFDDVKNYVTKYNDLIDVMSAPIDPRSAFKIESKYLDTIISSCIYKYDVILIDTSHNLSEITLSALDKSDNFILMVSNDPVDLKNTRNMICVFNDSNTTNFKVVFNSSKDTGKDYFTLFDVKSVINHNLDYTIDRTFYIKDIDKYVINGEILTLNKKILSSKRHDIKKLTNLACKLIEEESLKKVK